MAFLELNLYSESLGTQQQVYVVLPQKSAAGEIGITTQNNVGGYKTLYLLHGLSDNHTIWLRRTSIERYAQEYGICVVMPNGDRSFYTNMKHGGNYYTYIAEELPKLIEQFFHVSDRQEDRFIAGLSMGGYGALKIGLSEVTRFSAAAGLSAVADIRKDGLLFKEDMENIFGEDITIPATDDLFYLAEHCTNKPRLFMGVGTEDFLYESNQRLRHKLEEEGFDFTYRESAGTHCWAFWDEYIQYVLAWMFPERS